MPSEPAFTDNIFNWTPAYNDSGSYEVTFKAAQGQLEEFETIELSHFEFARKKIKASLTPKLLAKYNEISQELSNQKIRAAATFKEPGLFT